MTHIAARNDDVIAERGAVEVAAPGGEEAFWRWYLAHGREVLAEVCRLRDEMDVLLKRLEQEVGDGKAQGDSG